MRIVFISDTHGLHRDLVLPEGDMIIHAGDVSGRGHEKEVIDFVDWYASLPYKYKIFIAGNHDFYFEKQKKEDIDALIPESIIYLNDSGVTIEGVNIWGSPIQPWFYDWAFNRQRGADIRKHWELIPKNTDILITHGPPLGILDKTFKGESVGCNDLLDMITEMKIKVHVFGHIHEAYGTIVQNKTHYINASVLDLKYRMANDAVVLDI